VLDIASPVQPGHVDNADELIVPAREGTLRVLRAARHADVARVVLTSAFHAVAGATRMTTTFHRGRLDRRRGPRRRRLRASKTGEEEVKHAEALGDGAQLIRMPPRGGLVPRGGLELRRRRSTLPGGVTL
jgi:nucleoside-diphosphate-sugar epimerase